MKYIKLLIFVVLSSVFSNSVNALNFNFTTTGLSTQASAALNRAGNAWAQKITDSITINVSVNMDSSFNDNNVIGSAGSTVLVGGYTEIRDRLVLDASFESDDEVVSYLPNVSQIGFFVPNNFTLSNNLRGTKANFKALGYQGLDNDFGLNDGVINFNSEFSFDFDSSNGINSGQIDFEAVATHEIGHILGFVSSVDNIDATILGEGVTAEITPFLLDLFRFGPDDNPVTDDEFSSATRDITPGEDTYFDDLITEILFSTGTENGDGRQASHWKDDGITGELIGVMDPTLGLGQLSFISESDLRALDVIGYDIATVTETIAGIPLPGTFLLLGSGLLFLSAQRVSKDVASELKIPG